MRRFKKLSLIMAFAVAFSLTGCGDKKDNDKERTTATVTTEEGETDSTQGSGDNTTDVTDDGTADNTFDVTTEDGSDTQTTATTEAAKPGEKYLQYANMTEKEIVASLTLEEKASQMVLPQIQSVDNKAMKSYCYGGVLSKVQLLTYDQWQEVVDGFQTAAVNSEAGIPFIYGQDDVHGVNYALNTVIFPHNIGMGAANDPELMYEVGLITADEAKLCHMLWNYSPCVAQSVDPRWGRTYESYGSNLDIIKSLSVQYTKGLIDGGLIACPKHFIADGNVKCGTGENSDSYRLIDRGDAELTDAEIDELLSVYQELIDAGAQTIMISHSSLNGVKMHENGEYIMKLKNEMGFEGFIVSDWNSVQNTSSSSYYDQMVTAVNAGIDMFMEVDTFNDARSIIIRAVKNGDISEERVNDAVERIIRVKKNAGVIADPFCENMKTVKTETGSDEYRAVAERCVEESLVLVKNEGNLLPFKKGTKIYVTGPAADNAKAQCGGWTLDWTGSPDKDIPGVTTILAGFEQLKDKYGIEIITDESRAAEADVVLLVVGEESYAEWLGDTADLQLCGALGLEGNFSAIEEAKSLGKPIVACIVAGRNVIIQDQVNDWDSVVMCYLPGSEGQGVAEVLCGGANFRGKLPSPWYSSLDQIPDGKPWLEQGFGLTY